jgi:hypothetical protein
MGLPWASRLTQKKTGFSPEFCMKKFIPYKTLHEEIKRKSLTNRQIQNLKSYSHAFLYIENSSISQENLEKKVSRPKCQNKWL